MRDLHVTSPMMHGEDVVLLQNALFKLGVSPGPIDGRYGPATASAISTFQKSHGMAGTGVADTITQTALLQATVPIAPPSGSSVLGLAALEKAKSYVGVNEDPVGSNRTPFGEWFGINGVPWCNIFVSYCFANSTMPFVICSGFAGAGVKAGKGCAYVPTTEAWLRATGMWLGKAMPEPGDIVIYDWGGEEAEHIGIVESWRAGICSAGEFSAIEGNAQSGVKRMTRFMQQVQGFGRLRNA